MDKPKTDRVGRGILLMLLAIAAFVTQAAFIKETPRIPTGQVMFVRAALTLLVTLLWMRFSGLKISEIVPIRWKMHMWRAVAGSAAMSLGFTGIRMVSLPDNTAIRFITPVLIVIFAAVFLGERLRFVRLGAVLMGLVGVLIIIWPKLSVGLDDVQAIGTLVVLASACFAAVAQLLVKALSRTDPSMSIVVSFAVISGLFGLFSAAFGWVWPTGYETILLIVIGLIGGSAQIMITVAYRHADAGVLAPFSYSSMLFSLLYGYLWFNEYPTAPMLIGVALVILSGVLIFYRERQLARRK